LNTANDIADLYNTADIYNTKTSLSRMPDINIFNHLKWITGKSIKIAEKSIDFGVFVQVSSGVSSWRDT